MKNNLKSLFRTQTLGAVRNNQQLIKCLNAQDLTLLGIGAIVGAGIFVLTGIAAATAAGPGVIFSFILAGLACAFCALSYAELAASVGGCGSAYGYAYAGLGEIVAWIVGWVLLLEYCVACATIAIGWSGYVDNAFLAMGLSLPDLGFINLPAMVISLAISSLLWFGVRESVKINKIIVGIKLCVIILFIVLAAFYFRPDENWNPFLPFGVLGVVNGAALIFFAYIGFDAVSTAAEETIQPERNLPIGIIASLIICTVLYVLVAAVLTGAVSYKELDVASPISYALIKIGYDFGGFIIALGAIAGLTSTILVMQYGLSRIFLAMSRDGFFPRALSKINPKTNSPTRIIALAGILISFVAGLTPINLVAQLTNIGTLTAFISVCVTVIVLRYKYPDLPRPFKTPYSPLFPILGILLCLFLMFHLKAITWVSFLIWTTIGLIVYFCYGRKNSILTNKV
ncbi:MAG: amino acid permease [Legionellales bacterium]|jgi:APA family basic amino acid/polyamine antiporter